VGKTMENQETYADKKQIKFIEELKKKNLKVTKIIDEDLVFYGIQAPKEVFERYRYLLKVSDACNWSSDQNIVLLDFSLCPEVLRDLMKMKVFEAKFCLHEVIIFTGPVLPVAWLVHISAHPTCSHWAHCVSLWFGVLQQFTSNVTVAPFSTFPSKFHSNRFLFCRKEVCESDTVMCPLCDKRCKVWILSETCTYAKSVLFTNNGTMLPSATLFLEFWKRYRASYVCEWKVSDWSEEEEELILQIVNNVDCEPQKYKHSYLRSTVVLICVTIMILVIIGLTHALVVFRVFAAVFLAEGSWEFLSTHSNSGAMMLGALFHYVVIIVMKRKTRSFAETEKSFTIKMFTFQFFTYFSSLFYVAFFLGRINGHPGGYVRIAGIWRLEECHPSGCLTDLFIQMAIIMVLKQTISNVFEFIGPWFSRWLKRRRTKKLQRKCGHCYHKDDTLDSVSELCECCKLRDWLNNYHLNDVDSFSLFNEFLEMVIQFSFTTIFVAAFPLAPLLALLNNIIEIRLDAIKMVTLERRLVPKKTNDIGVWIDVLEAIGVLAVIANGLVIGVSSDFIPRQVYRYLYGPCANGNATDTDCMVGYINNTLSLAYANDQDIHNEFSASQMVTPSGMNVSYCSYKDYRSDEDYSLTPQFWLISAVRFAFVILFEHVLVICKFIAAWFIPSAPMEVKNDRLFDKLNRLKEELK
uniref:Anoctamin n=1 Tax=Neogobius melanostomus TaxID=47308 RepID=A0A8C6UVH5_9GOBI